MSGGELGHDLLQKRSYRLYSRTIVGLRTSEEWEDEIGITRFEAASIDYVRETCNEYIDYPLTISLGYNYRVNDWLPLGVDFTYYKIAYR